MEAETMFNFVDKVVMITGGSRGLGKAMAEGFANAGAKVIIASRKLDACEGECPTNCVNPVIHITLEEFMNHGINNERQRPAGHGRQGGRGIQV